LHENQDNVDIDDVDHVYDVDTGHPVIFHHFSMSPRQQCRHILRETGKQSQFCELNAMASYSVALQLRAAEETIKRDMPCRSLATRLVLFCDVASTLLLFQLGQFTHVAAGLFGVILRCHVSFCLLLCLLSTHRRFPTCRILGQNIQYL